jgi:hypothetical protein
MDCYIDFHVTIISEDSFDEEVEDEVDDAEVIEDEEQVEEETITNSDNF